MNTLPHQPPLITPYPEINSLLHLLLIEVQAALREQFIAMYVHGSLASGDFNPQRSDIDFVVVTAGTLPNDMLVSLENMHARISASDLKGVTKLEGIYIPKDAIRRYDPKNAWHPALRAEEGFAMDGLGSDWVIQLHTIREQGLVLAGPAPQTLIDTIQPEELRLASLKTLKEWWVPQLMDHSLLRRDEYQAYAVLTMCRVLYTLHYGRIVSKSSAAIWALKNLTDTWAVLIQGALDWQPGVTWNKLNETLDFIRYILEQSSRIVINDDPL